MLFIVSPGQVIQNAVNGASPGDTILVRAGTYHQNVSIPVGKDRLRIIGAGAGKTVLDGSLLPADSGVTMVGTSHVTIAGLTIRNFRSVGIDLFDVEDVILRDNELLANESGGLRLVSCSRALVKGNAAIGNLGNGISVGTGSDHAYVIENHARNNRHHGIEVNGSHVLVYRNKAEENEGNGIFVQASESWIIDNVIRGNKQSGIDTPLDVTHLFIAGNEATENGEDGLKLSTSQGRHIVFDNTFSRNGDGDSAHGIFVSAGETLLFRNRVEENKETNINGSDSFTRSLLLANLVTRSKDEGIDTAGGDQDRILYNRVEQNVNFGIVVGSNDHLIDDNTVHANGGNGIHLRSNASRCAVRANALKGNDPLDLSVEPSADVDNAFDHNKCDHSSPVGIGG